MKEIQEWNPYYIGASCSLYRPEQFYPWLYPYGSSRHYISLWNDPEQMEDVEDKKRIMEMYPLMARRLQPYVEECCDRLAVLRARLNALAAGKLRGGLPANTILTPHPGEAARLLGTTVAEIQADRAQAARQLAEKQGRPRMSAQAVGGAVGHNKISIIIPCHRVVGTGGSLTGYAGGIDRKVKLLALEQADMTRFFVPKTGTALL